MLERNVEILKLQLDNEQKLINEILKASYLDMLSDVTLIRKVNEIDQEQKNAIKISEN